jgi:hypothetical protein
VNAHEVFIEFRAEKEDLRPEINPQKKHYE